MAVMLSAAAMSVGQWVDPIVEEEVHYKPSRFHRYEAVGLTADEKAGLTVGFVITAFLILCLLIVVGMNHSFAVTIAERVEALEKTTSKLVEAAEKANA